MITNMVVVYVHVCIIMYVVYHNHEYYHSLLDYVLQLIELLHLQLLLGCTS